ncbi:aspartyl/asparaginyl beta-hydroxylase domain-containing protein [Sphingomonas sp. DT-51]|uniref:aspartyl/asparaginyl beta-hydroxylase domain-containing protein n=1 Tax=Sphingomonas sp. DT-51 TaxID=3396165 RepID=UPI003F19630C
MHDQVQTVGKAGKRSNSTVLRFGKKLRPALNRRIERASLIPVTPILDPAVLPWIEQLRANWLAIQAEYDALATERDVIPPLGQIAAYHRRIAPDDKWRSFFFEAHGYEVVANKAKCPNTAAMLDDIPDLVTAFFSVMDAGTHVPRHKGFSKALLNIHLGLRVPAGVEECRIEVENQTRGWANGEILMFDESFPHEVWNDSDKSRAILFIQVLRPMKASGRLLAHAIIKFMNLTKYVQQARHSIGATPKRHRL